MNYNKYALYIIIAGQEMNIQSRPDVRGSFQNLSHFFINRLFHLIQLSDYKYYNSVDWISGAFVYIAYITGSFVV